MEAVRLIAILQFLTNEIITQSDIAAALGVTKGAINNKIIRGSKFRNGEIEQIEKHFDISFNDFKLAQPNTFERQNDTSIPQKAEKFGRRMTEIQDMHEYLDKDMAKLLRISEEDYIDLKLGNIEPDFRILVRLKQCFKVSIDWLLFGD